MKPQQQQPQQTSGHIQRGHVPAGPKKNVGMLISPRTKQAVYVFAKKGEAENAAIRRVAKHHGLNI